MTGYGRRRMARGFKGPRRPKMCRPEVSRRRKSEERHPGVGIAGVGSARTANRRRVRSQWSAAADRVLPDFGRRAPHARDRRNLRRQSARPIPPRARSRISMRRSRICAAREGMPDTSAVGFVELGAGRQSDVAMDRHPQAVATIAAWAGRTVTTPRSGPRLRATSMSGAKAASRSRSPRRSVISKRWKARTPTSSPAR